MASKKRMKWVIGLSSVATFTGIVGLLHQTDDNSVQTALTQNTMENGNTGVVEGENQNPFSGNTEMPEDSVPSEGDTSSSTSNSWAGDYPNDGTSSQSETENSASNSYNGQVPESPNSNYPNNGNENYNNNLGNGGSYPANGSMESGTLHGHAS